MQDDIFLHANTMQYVYGLSGVLLSAVVVLRLSFVIFILCHGFVFMLINPMQFFSI